MRTFLTADLHGNFRGLRQVLHKAGFDYQNDRLITLGDYVDGYSQTYEVVEELLKIPNRICLKGNHDQVFLRYLATGEHEFDWDHGAISTAQSYLRFSGKPITEPLKTEDVPESHLEFFRGLKNYYLEDNVLFVHAGINRHSLLEETFPTVFLWDRDFFNSAVSHSRTGTPYKHNFDKVYLGHTPTLIFDCTEPMVVGNIINMDTGAGYKKGKVTLLNLKTDEIFQSETGEVLYPQESGR